MEFIKRKNNKGFSLVELIIVIAIMAILVAIMVPVLLIFIEKSNVSSDTQLADTVRGAFLCAVTDARVLADAASEPYFDDLEDSDGMNIEDLGTSVMKESVEEILGMNVTDVKNQLKSSHSSPAVFNIKLHNKPFIL